MTLENLVRPNIQSLKPYSSARDEFSGADCLFFDANENPYGAYNRYPDPHQKSLKAKISELKSIPADQIFIGNGSDEVIDLAFRIFCEPQQDEVLICPPTYGMYEVSANINNIKIVKVPLDENFQLDIKGILETLKNHPKIKLIFLCNPNNPTGNHLSGIEEVLQNFQGIVMVDEAYIDFSSQPSLLSKINSYPNLIVSQTLSKAWGKASLRIGLAIANKQIISYFNKVKPPYNISKPNQTEALKALSDINTYQEQLQIINAQKTLMVEALNGLPFVEKVYPSEANFLLVKTTQANQIYQTLINQQLVVRNRHTVVDNCLRITIGTPQENQMLINALNQIL